MSAKYVIRAKGPHQGMVCGRVTFPKLQRDRDGHVVWDCRDFDTEVEIEETGERVRVMLGNLVRADSAVGRRYMALRRRLLKAS